jgi:hypothetical protein
MGCGGVATGGGDPTKTSGKDSDVIKLSVIGLVRSVGAAVAGSLPIVATWIKLSASHSGGESGSRARNAVAGRRSGCWITGNVSHKVRLSVFALRKRVSIIYKYLYHTCNRPMSEFSFKNTR